MIQPPLQTIFDNHTLLPVKNILTLCILLNALQTFTQNPGDAFFAGLTVHEIRFQFSQPGYFDSLKTNYTLDQYMRCDLSIDGVSFPQCGVKYKGNSSYNNPGKKKPFRIDFQEYVPDQVLDGMNKIVLNNGFKDPTFLREKLMLDFLNEHDIAAPRATFARLYINDHYWGVYSVVEDVNKTFLKTHFDNKGGNLFKGDPRGILVWKGPDQSLYTGDYELKTNETENDWSDLIHLINVLNNTPNAQLYDSLAANLNLESWYSYWVAHNMFANLDSYVGSGHNYLIYHNKDTGKFEWITWDVNEAFGNFQMNLSLDNIKTLPTGFIPQPANQRPMMNKCWTNQALQQGYLDRYCDLLTDFSNEKMDDRIDAMANLIRQDVYADTLKFFTNTHFDQNLSQDLSIPGTPGAGTIAGLKPFIAARRTALKQQLIASGCNTTGYENILSPKLVIFPNPAVSGVRISAGGQNMKSIELFQGDGRNVFFQSIENQSIINLMLPKLPTDIYYVVVKTDAGLLHGKLVISN